MYRLLAFLVVLSFFVSCKKEKKIISEQKDTVFFSKTISPNSIIFADPISYDVVVKNPDKEDEWTESCLKNTDADTLIDIIFNAIYSGKLVPYHYWYKDSIVPLDSIKNFEKLIRNYKIGKMSFEEQWFFDTDSMKMYKKVNSIIIGYGIKDNLGAIGSYRAMFKVFLDKNKNGISK